MSSESFETLYAEAERILPAHIDFIRKVVSNASDLKLRDIRLTFPEMRRACESAARTVIPTAVEVLGTLLSENPEIMHSVSSENAAHKPLRVIVHECFVDRIVSMMYENLVERHGKQFSDFVEENLVGRCSEALEAFSRGGEGPGSYAETFNAALDGYLRDANEKTISHLAFVSEAFCGRLRLLGEREIARRLVEETDFAARNPDRFTAREDLALAI